ncbi:hypothetical protein Q7P35_012179 [Cladosporium inversicolor]
MSNMNYQQPAATQQWNPNQPAQQQPQQQQTPNAQQAPPPPQQQPPQQVQQQQPQQQPQQQQPQPQWSPQPQQNGQYAPRPNQLAQLAVAEEEANADATKQIPSLSQAVPPQPQHPPVMQDPYRSLPPPAQMYPGYGPPMGYAAPAQPAPRQRTAIACRYCRRRKIRCSGFDQSEDGRCTNCQRFSQECVFTPVSAQTQAFVPAHTVWRGQQPPPNAQLYEGAYGQPLPHNQQQPQQQRDQYPPQGQQQPGQYPPPPPGYQQQPGQPVYPQPPQQGTPPQMQGQEAGRKRGTDEPHTPTIPPPNPGVQASLPRDGQYPYPDPSILTPSVDFTSEKDGDMSVIMPQRNGEMKDAQTQTDDDLLLTYVPHKEPVSQDGSYTKTG